MLGAKIDLLVMDGKDEELAAGVQVSRVEGPESKFSSTWDTGCPEEE